MGRAIKLSRLSAYMLGPEIDGGICLCIRCQKPIEPGQLWLKQWAPKREYAVGVHVSCMKRDRPGERKFRDCGIDGCGHLTQNEADAALHLRFVHKIAYGVDLNTLLGATEAQQRRHD